ncbi:uncharacterized protein LTR77_007351 [Saxophila tyrrhenica]|uniref:hydroxymethylglutaryl-CoA lyase n=1 Tax=Saxophila tyrrhenica TaxID=1690608 RepID=A0AAV9P4Y4_9PEZI|nr:hypothetical protein LTR77_007351 [Saxophila tyrrhenica]
MKAFRTTSLLARQSQAPLVFSRSPYLRRYRSTVSNAKPDVSIVEVGPRDGLQNIKTQVDTSIKIELIQRLAASGLRTIEATSFVAPKWIPQLADSKEVMQHIVASGMQKSINFPVLVPNLKGFEGAAASKAQEAVLFAAASEGFSRKNTNCSVEEALTRAEDVAKACLAQGIRARGVISCIFACPYDGPTDPAKVLSVAKRFLEMGCYEVGLGDTLGIGTAADTEKLLRILLSEIPADKLAGHYHDTYGQAVANVIKSYDMGLRTFDSSVAGLGGCPHAKGATGNVATEDVVYMFERAGVATGVDLQQLSETGDWISKQVGQKNGSRAGSALVAKGQTKPAAPPSSTKVEAASPEWRVESDDGELRVSRAGNVVKVTLTRTRNGNALSNSMVEGVTNLYNTLAKDPTVFQIILNAEGKFFCTGMDLSSSGSSASGDQAVKDDYYNKVEGLFVSIMNSPQTTIAVVDGLCYGGGVGLAFACDVRLVSPKARFTMTEIKLGLSPATISRHMIREWGISFSREAMLSGRTVTPEELKGIGAVHGIASSAEDLERLLNEYLQGLRNCAPKSAAAVKELVRLGWNDPGGEEQTKYVKHVFEQMMVPGSEGEHGMAQFRKKNKNVDWGHFWSSKLSA